MDALWILFFLFLAGLLLAFPFIVWHRLSMLRHDLRQQQERVRQLHERLHQLERPGVADLEGRAPAESAREASWQVPAPSSRGSAPAAPPLTVVEPAAPALPAALMSPAPATTIASSAPVTPYTSAPSAPVPPAAPVTARALEDIIGGVWMQNIGAVVLLLGVFLFILWGYSTGRLGAGVLVGTGVGLGLVAVWRGDRLARSLPRLGHAFIGAGFGAIYLSLYLGHYTLHVLPTVLALVLLTLTSAATFGAGLHYRVQAIAAFGVLGAFIPSLFAAWFELRGFSLEPMPLLGYLAIVDVLVFALAARAGWSGLDLAALLLTTLTWISSDPRPGGSWAPNVGLGVLFTGLGFAPLPRLLGVEGQVRAADVAVIACAPAALLITTWPWLAQAPHPTAALYLFSLAALHLLAAAWVDSRRPERDLWRPLTGAAVVFLTMGLQRLVRADALALTWAVEGVLLVLLGLSPRSGWLRLCGHVITTAAVLVALFDPTTWGQVDLPSRLIDSSTLYEAGVIAALSFGAWALARGRERLARLERWTPEAWTFAGNFLLLFWLTARADELTGALHRRFTFERMPRGEAGSWHRWPGLFVSLLGMMWLVQATVLVWRGARRDRTFLRCCGYGVAAFSLVAVLAAHAMRNHWLPGVWPVFYPEGIVSLASMLLLLVIVLRLARHRAVLTSIDRQAPEAFAVGLLAISLLWSAREAGHVAVMVSGAHLGSRGTGTLAAALTSVAWLLEAVLLLALGWMRTRALLRWSGLVILGLTLAKFMVYDLASADVFWRFLTAIAAGAAMLAVSYAYQRRVRERKAGETKAVE